MMSPGVARDLMEVDDDDRCRNDLSISEINNHPKVGLLSQVTSMFRLGFLENYCPADWAHRPECRPPIYRTRTFILVETY